MIRRHLQLGALRQYNQGPQVRPALVKYAGTRREWPDPRGAIAEYTRCLGRLRHGRRLESIKLPVAFRRCLTTECGLNMQGTKIPRDRKEDGMRAPPLDFTGQTFSELELKNQKFKRVAWAAALILIGIVTVLVLQLAGVIAY